ncbi:hypothetical protein ACXHXG_11340 [Rhizobium sp. LEGMi198b]
MSAIVVMPAHTVMAVKIEVDIISLLNRIFGIDYRSESGMSRDRSRDGSERNEKTSQPSFVQPRTKPSRNDGTLKKSPRLLAFRRGEEIWQNSYIRMIEFYIKGESGFKKPHSTSLGNFLFLQWLKRLAAIATAQRVTPT